MRHTFVVLMLAFASSVTASAREVKDTLFSDAGDRIILTYNLTNAGGQMSVHFMGAQKKLGSKNQKKYKKLDEVVAVFFDRNGNYADTKFDGMETNAFMVPANMSYTRSNDGYFLINDNPNLQLKIAQNEEATLNIPVYLASYEGKRHYKVFAQCGMLTLSSKKAKAGGSRSGGGGGHASGEMYAANAENIQIVGDTEELEDEGLSPAEEALIRVNSVKSMLEQATEFPFDEELTHEASMLRELRFKVTDDEEVSKQINETLALYDAKKKELAGEAKGAAAAKEAAAAQAAQAAQARTDSIAAAQAKQAEEDKKNMMWIGGGIAALMALFMGGKQIMQVVAQKKLEKQQKEMMDNVLKMSQNPQTQGAIGMPNMATMKGMEAKTPSNSAAQTSQNAQPAQKETILANDTKEAIPISETQQPAKTHNYRTLKPKPRPQVPTREQSTNIPVSRPQTSRPQSQLNPSIPSSPTRPSLNDAIPAKYKRLAKRGDSSQQS